MGVRDSKKLAPSVREGLEPELKRALEGVAVVTVDAARLDRLMKDRTLNEIEVRLFGEAVLTAADNARVGGVDVLQLDAADTDEAAFGRYVMSSIAARSADFRVGEVASKHRGDSLFPAVGAASILAKVERDRQIKRISEQVGKDIGSGYPSDDVTIRFLREYISANRDIPPFCRRSWQTTTDLLNEAGLLNRPLEEFDE
jgi:ribonuclease HII